MRPALVTFLFLLSAWPVHGAANLRGEHLDGLALRNIGPAAMSGRIVDVEVSTLDPYLFYVASATGGLWKTTNNGVTYEPVFDREAVHSIGDVAIHPRQPGLVWLGSGERANRQSSSWGNGVYRSADGGASWQHMGLEQSHHVGRIALDPRDPDTVYVAAMGHLWGPNEERGLYKSTDGGERWQRVLATDADTGVVDVAIDPKRPRVVYAATYQRRRTAYGFHGGGPGSGIHRSTDGGASWEELTGRLPDLEDAPVGRIGIAIAPSDPRTVYLSVEQGLRYTASTSYEKRKAGIYRSDDRGRSWRYQGDWNPRPMYASQISVDPQDRDRVFMMNSFSISADGGKTFEVPRQSVHSDDRFLWIDPRESRHLIKASDGALAISWDRGKTWLWSANLPVSQYYRVAVDYRDPYWVYGGLQDNGTWAGPNATYRSEGVLNEDWIRLGGGDGFAVSVHPQEPDLVFGESQYLGLFVRDLRTLESRSIRPGDPEGHISDRKNWDYWGSDRPAPELGNAMQPANWDGPFLLSPHDPDVLWAGTDRLWRSGDRGASWQDLGRLTSDTERASLPIMGELPRENTPSLDDGIPYYPTLSAIAESPRVPGLLWVGTDDGLLHRSRDAGGSWTELSARLPELPERSYVAGIEASRWSDGVVWVAFDNHRSDDFENHLYRSTDFGESWVSVVGDLPPRRVVRAVHEDPRSPRLLYVATEFGVFVSWNAGLSGPESLGPGSLETPSVDWVELGGEMPTVAINDFVVHPRDNDLILATHGRGIWILDGLGSLQELTPEIAQRPAHLFSVPRARMVRRTGLKAASGDTVFSGENPPEGALIDYWLREARAEEEAAEAPGSDEAAESDEDLESEPEGAPGVRLRVLDARGDLVRDLTTTGRAGMNRVVWDLRYPRLPAPAGVEPRPGRPAPRGPEGPRVSPGRYVVELEVDAQHYRSSLEVEEDPRVALDGSERRDWTERLLQLGALYERSNSLVERLPKRESPPEGAAPQERADPDAERPDTDSAYGELRRQAIEVRDRARGLYRAVSGWTGEPTADQRHRQEFLAGALAELEERESRVEESGD